MKETRTGNRNRLEAPWDQVTVDALNRYQKSGGFHPFTCGRRDTPAHHGDESVLIATTTGWICPHCSYTQNWAHAGMAIGLETAIGPLDLLTTKRGTPQGSARIACQQLEKPDIHQTVADPWLSPVKRTKT